MQPDVLAWALGFVVVFGALYRVFVWIGSRAARRTPPPLEQRAPEPVAEPPASSPAVSFAPPAPLPQTPVLRPVHASPPPPEPPRPLVVQPVAVKAAAPPMPARPAATLAPPMPAPPAAAPAAAPPEPVRSVTAAPSVGATIAPRTLLTPDVRATLAPLPPATAPAWVEPMASQAARARSAGNGATPPAAPETDDGASHLRDAKLRARRIGEPPPRLDSRVKGTAKRKSSQAAKALRKGAASARPSKWLSPAPKRNGLAKTPPGRIGTSAMKLPPLAPARPATRIVGVPQRGPRVPVAPPSAAPQSL